MWVRSGTAAAAALAALLLAAGSSPHRLQQAMAREAMVRARDVGASEFAAVDWVGGQREWMFATALDHMGRYAEANDAYVVSASLFNRAEAVAEPRRSGLVNEVGELRSNISEQSSALQRALRGMRVGTAARRTALRVLADVGSDGLTMDALASEHKLFLAREIGYGLLRELDFAQQSRASVGLHSKPRRTQPLLPS